MYRLIPCLSDAYITNKIIKGSRTSLSRSQTSNVGQATTIDLFKLYNETPVHSGSSGIERTVGLFKFDIDSLKALTGSYLDINNGSFKCTLKLFDAYTGLPTPSNFSLVLHPLAKNFDEGRGMDVASFKDIDAVNWLTASVLNNSSSLWTTPGASSGSFVGSLVADYFTSGSLSGVTSSLFVSQTFSRGDEDFSINITRIVSGVISNQIPNYGFRLSFDYETENDQYSYFVKRFYSRSSSKKFKRPVIIVEFDDTTIEHTLEPIFDNPTVLGLHNSVRNVNKNFISASTELTGSNCLLLDLIGEKTLTFWTSSWSVTHSRSINHLTSTLSTFTASFTGSQQKYGNSNLYITGSYFASASLFSTASLVEAFLNNDRELSLKPVWKSLDGNMIFSIGDKITYKFSDAVDNNSIDVQNLFCSLTNLKEVYIKGEVPRIRLIALNYRDDIANYYVPPELKSVFIGKMFWRLKNIKTDEVIIPFSLTTNSTKLSVDGEGMFFDLYTNDLQENEDYILEFLGSYCGREQLFTNKTFTFKITV